MFLAILLSLINKGELYAQYCISMIYDNNGNRIEKSIIRCITDDEYDASKDNPDDKILLDKVNDNVLIYPNPTRGIINVKVENEDSNLLIYELYDNKGVMIKKALFYDHTIINLTNYPASCYLLRIIADDNIFVKIVVKQ